MRDATPEERVAALRRLRNVNNSNGESSDSESTRTRLSARLSRAFNHDSSRRGSTLNPDNARSRRGSALNTERSGAGDEVSRPVSAVLPERGSYAG